ncbi:glycosyltransferase [Rhizobium tumorigenes]|uniref:glycosyltransferase n=1 Tax=Rhizobium tumorigenes TaxID=2041385 RepID=UPI00241DA860|nr:glycosyltransferase [Rhizobium tumorigenes]WFS03317.1 glycosyltransferase [Rhizobium tumorigenes]
MNSSACYAINGRFLSQTGTGVQRYALNVVKAIDRALVPSVTKAAIISPLGFQDASLLNLEPISSGRISGHLWEQTVLPTIWRGRLLNLCNTAPVFKNDQIVCIHDANIFASPDSYTNGFRFFYGNLQSALVRRSIRIATVSHAAARQISRHLPIAESDIAVLPNGHEHALEWDPGRATLAPKFLGDNTGLERRPFVLVIGSRARHKNLRLLIDVAPALDELGIDILIAGGGAEIYASDNLVERSNVRFVGRVTDDDLAYLLSEALCLAFPSFTEGFGLPIVEAMARGCPVVSSDSASMPEVCGKAALLASPLDPTSWVRHFSALQTSPELRRDLVGRGYEQMKQFSWSETAKGYLDLLEDPSTQMRSAKSGPSAPLRVTVVIATRGRPDIVAATVRYILERQTLRPERVIVSCSDVADAGELNAEPDVTVITGPPGLAIQRNRSLEHVPAGTDIVAFFDDDFIAGEKWLEVAANVFREECQVVGFTGHLVADGINGAGISFEDGVNMVETNAPADRKWIEPYSPYGCNMAFRFRSIGQTRFDERLVLYGWLEDRDFAATLGKKGGRFVKCPDAIGVHMGVKSGRVAGDRLGYSQVANPIYMLLKGTMSLANVANHIGANMASNFGKAIRPEPFVDRRGRARGNLIALGDILRGRVEPERAALVSRKVETLQTISKRKL